MDDTPIIPRLGVLSTLNIYIYWIFNHFSLYLTKNSVVWLLHFFVLKGKIWINTLTGGNSITDEDGNEFELEYVETIEYQGQVYMAFFPADTGEAENEEEGGLIILKVIEVDGEEQLSTLDSEEELEAVYDQFMEALFQEDEDNED